MTADPIMINSSLTQAVQMLRDLVGVVLSSHDVPTDELLILHDEIVTAAREALAGGFLFAAGELSALATEISQRAPCRFVASP